MESKCRRILALSMLDVDIVDRMRPVKDSRGEEAEVRMWRAWS